MTTPKRPERMYPLTLADIRHAEIVHVPNGTFFRVSIGTRECLLPPSDALAEVLSERYPTRADAENAARVVFPNAKLGEGG